MSSRRLIDTLLPPLCIRCGRPLDEGRPFCVCPDCLATLETLQPPLCPRCSHPLSEFSPCCPDCHTLPPPLQSFTRILVLSPHFGLARTMVEALKYKGHTALAPLLGQLLARLLTDNLPPMARPLLTPVPMDTLRIVQRGYNQAALLAQAIAEAGGFDLCLDALDRTPGMTATGQKSRKARLEALGRNIVPGRAGDTCVADRLVVVVDDVVTTGATMAGCAMVLRTRGAATVMGLALCRRVLSPLPGI